MTTLWLNTMTGEVTVRDDPPPELLPCPFCGGKAWADQILGDWIVKCLDCYSCTGRYRETDRFRAISAWNRRAPAKEDG